MYLSRAALQSLAACALLFLATCVAVEPQSADPEQSNQSLGGRRGGGYHHGGGGDEDASDDHDSSDDDSSSGDNGSSDDDESWDDESWDDESSDDDSSGRCGDSDDCHGHGGQCDHDWEPSCDEGSSDDDSGSSDDDSSWEDDDSSSDNGSSSDDSSSGEGPGCWEIAEEYGLVCEPGPVPDILVEFHCTAIFVVSCKELSNVVLEFEDGSRQRFECLSGCTGWFSGTGEHEGAVIVTAWVKSGRNHSGDGPGYGERFDAPADSCCGPDDVCTPECDEDPDCDDPEPIDCVVSEWSEWEGCDKDCGGGMQSRYREVLVWPENGGSECPYLEDKRPCNEDPCPIDCKVTDWSEWSDCSVECGGGEQTRTRDIDVHPEYGGMECPELIETQACNVDACEEPIDCVVSEWGEWSSCSADCGGGTQSRARSVETPPAYGGAECPNLTEDQACNTDPCPVDCVVGDWGPWDTCSETCGGGEQSRARPVTTPAEHGGAACPDLVETQACNQQACPANCEVSAWSDWSDCFPSCGEGRRARTRDVVVPPDPGGADCPPLRDEEVCFNDPCPIDCVMSTWSEWGACSEYCDGGTQEHTRTIVVQPQYGGAPCGPTVESQACNEQPCDVDCVLGDWGDWRECSVECGWGTQSRARTVETPPEGNGQSCDPLIETRDCQVRECCVEDAYCDEDCIESGTCTEVCAYDPDCPHPGDICDDVIAALPSDIDLMGDIEPSLVDPTQIEEICGEGPFCVYQEGAFIYPFCATFCTTPVEIDVDGENEAFCEAAGGTWVPLGLDQAVCLVREGYWLHCIQVSTPK